MGFMRFGYVELFSQNLPESAAWWEDTMGAVIINEQDDEIWLAIGEAEILLRQQEGTAKNAVRLVFYSEDLADDRSRLKSGGTKIREDNESVLIQDHDGRWHRLVEPPM